MKSIKIVGKRNIDGFSSKKEKKRKALENIDNEELFLKTRQIEWLNKLYLEQQYNGIGFAKKELERKIKSYKNQDIAKNKHDPETLIKYDECLEKLFLSKLKCYYCKTDCMFLYKNVRDTTQWTLDRLNNDIGHTNDNVVICCLKCNLKRGRLDDEKFKFTKQMKIVKKY